MKARSTFNNSTLKIVLAALLLMVASIAGVYYINQNSRVDAVKAADFKDGNIISDYVFYNKDSMTAQQIQDFLNGLIPTCLTWNNTTFVDGGGTRVGPPFVCLNNYYENPDTGETSFEKGGGAFAGGISAAQIIYNASQQYGINPQVLLVMLKKESLGPLTADNWPTKWQYRYAMGYACPDSGPNNSANCNDKQAGFYKQVNLAAWQFKYYKEHPNDYRYALGWNDIQYSPDASCGTKRVYIENIATLSLYIYTPYTPNTAALANYPGTASCGAYGNRNFFMFFSEWFGSTSGQAKWEAMTTPRVMSINQDTLKVTANTLDTEGAWLTAGSQIVFDTKTTLYNGEACLRTRYDTENNISRCVLLKRLDEFTPTYQPINDSSKANIYISTSTCKVSLQNITALCDSANLRLHQEIKISATTTIGDTTYFITRHDSNNNLSLGIRTDRASTVPGFTSIDTVEMTPLEKARVANPSTNNTISSVQAFKTMKFDSVTSINGKRYYRDVATTSAGLYGGIEEQYLSVSIFEPFLYPRQLKTTRLTSSVNPFIKSVCQENITALTTFKFSSKILLGDTLYFRTQASTDNNLTCAIPATDLAEL